MSKFSIGKAMRLELPRFQVVVRIPDGSESIAWFWKKRLANEYLKFKEQQKRKKP